jgi:hypothetical protein
MKERADWEDTTTVLLSMVGAIGAWLWLQSIGAGILAFVVLLVGIARLARKGEARNWAEWEHTVKRAIILVAVIGSFALAFIFVWMNRYSYQHKGMMIVRINRFSGQVCHLQNDGTWNSNLVAPPKWLETFMRHPDFRASHSYGPNTLEKGVSGDKPGTIIPLEDAEKQAQAYALNTCE